MNFHENSAVRLCIYLLKNLYNVYYLTVQANLLHNGDTEQPHHIAIIPTSFKDLKNNVDSVLFKVQYGYAIDLVFSS